MSKEVFVSSQKPLTGRGNGDVFSPTRACHPESSLLGYSHRGSVAIHKSAVKVINGCVADVEEGSVSGGVRARHAQSSLF